MNPLQDISELLGIHSENRDYENMGREEAVFATSNKYLESQQMIFGNSFSGITNPWAYQQMNIAPTLAASSQYE